MERSAPKVAGDLPVAAGVTTPPALDRAGRERIEIVDLLRGLMIVLMILDHTREYFHVDALQFDPTDPDRTTSLLFATRWVTHLCAPTFVFLAGVSVHLQEAAGTATRRLSRILLTRGLWLIALEFTVVSFGFDFAAPFAFLQVIWAIGIGMIGLSLLVWTKPMVAAAVGTAIIVGHQTIPGGFVASLGPLWRLGFAPGPMPFGPGLVAYPAVPWFGVIALGYGLGSMFLGTARERRKRLTALAAVMLVAFAILRVANGYGDPRPWIPEGGLVRSAMSFFDLSKYPPSLDYLLATLGVSLLLCQALWVAPASIKNVLLAFGRTPFFTYLIHIYVVHGLATLIGVASGVPASAFFGYLGDPSRLEAAHWGVPLAWVYLIWLSIVACLYPPSRWFAGVKSRRRDWWLAYV